LVVGRTGCGPTTTLGTPRHRRFTRQPTTPVALTGDVLGRSSLLCSAGPAGSITCGGSNATRLPVMSAEYDRWGSTATTTEGSGEQADDCSPTAGGGCPSGDARRRHERDRPTARRHRSHRHHPRRLLAHFLRYAQTRPTDPLPPPHPWDCAASISGCRRGGFAGCGPWSPVRPRWRIAARPARRAGSSPQNSREAGAESVRGQQIPCRTRRLPHPAGIRCIGATGAADVRGMADAPRSTTRRRAGVGLSTRPARRIGPCPDQPRVRSSRSATNFTKRPGSFGRSPSASTASPCNRCAVPTSSSLPPRSSYALFKPCTRE
jgi:hypothetical protein